MLKIFFDEILEGQPQLPSAFISSVLVLFFGWWTQSQIGFLMGAFGTTFIGCLIILLTVDHFLFRRKET